LEVSFCGSDASSKGTFQYNVGDLLQIGKIFGETIQQYSLLGFEMFQLGDKPTNLQDVTNLRSEMMARFINNDSKIRFLNF
jgi:hypothetical protein